MKRTLTSKIQTLTCMENATVADCRHYLFISSDSCSLSQYTCTWILNSVMKGELMHPIIFLYPVDRRRADKHIFHKVVDCFSKSCCSVKTIVQRGFLSADTSVYYRPSIPRTTSTDRIKLLCAKRTVQFVYFLIKSFKLLLPHQSGTTPMDASIHQLSLILGFIHVEGLAAVVSVYLL